MAITNKKLQKMMTLPINQIFTHLRNKDKVQIWLYDQQELRMEGKIVGIDNLLSIKKVRIFLFLFYAISLSFHCCFLY